MRVIWVGRRARDPLLDTVDDYRKRLRRYCKFEVVQLKEAETAVERQRILAKLAPRDTVIALDERGEDLSSREFAALVGDFPRATFVIGGADGLGDAVRERAKRIVRLSALTLPHRMALALLMEQLYRAHTILRGEKYHRD